MLIVKVVFLLLTKSFCALTWPDGSYALPEPLTGCPNNWTNSYVYHNTEDVETANQHSNSSYHLMGLFSQHGIEQSFCVKSENKNESENEIKSILKWTPGKYCIYKKNSCPYNMREGSITWNDEESQTEDVPTHHEGDLPDGEYNMTMTKIYFCCSVTGSVNDPLLLPTDRPFYLFPYGSTDCQRVLGMKHSLEWVFYDDNDEGNRDAISGFVPYGPNPDKDFNIKLYFCYYEQDGGFEGMSDVKNYSNSEKVKKSEQPRMFEIEKADEGKSKILEHKFLYVSVFASFVVVLVVLFVFVSKKKEFMSKFLTNVYKTFKK